MRGSTTGGIAPSGYSSEMRVVIDTAQPNHEEIYAVAGTPCSAGGIAPWEPREDSWGEPGNLKE